MENLTLKQQFILEVFTSGQDENKSCTVNIHGDLQYPTTPNSINPAIRDMQALLDNGFISDYERLSSRVFKVNLI